MTTTIRGTIKAINNTESGAKQDGNIWSRTTVILVTDSKFPSVVAIDFYNDNIQKLLQFAVGQLVDIDVTCSSRAKEYNNRVFYNTTIKGYNIRTAVSDYVANLPIQLDQQQPQPEPQPQQSQQQFNRQQQPVQQPQQPMQPMQQPQQRQQQAQQPQQRPVQQQQAQQQVQQQQQPQQFNQQQYMNQRIDEFYKAINQPTPEQQRMNNVVNQNEFPF